MGHDVSFNQKIKTISKVFGSQAAKSGRQPVQKELDNPAFMSGYETPEQAAKRKQAALAASEDLTPQQRKKLTGRSSLLG